MPLRIHCLRQSRSSLRGSSGPLSELFPTRILFRNLPPTSTLKSHLSPPPIMTSDSQSQNQQAQGSQSQTRKIEKPRSPLKRLGEALGNFLLKHQIEKDLDKKLNDIIESQKIEGSAKKEMKDKVDEIVEKLKKNLQEGVVRDLKNDYQKLRDKVQLFLISFGGLIAILVFMGGPVISNILSLDVLEADIKTLKEDVEDLREDQMQN